jgi:RNA polymerase sigma factor (TIGR02999 family)
VVLSPLGGKYVLSKDNITEMLVEWSNGNEAARDKLMPIIEKELRQLAVRYMHNERPDHTLQPTALINETYIRFLDIKDVHWRNRAHFFGIAAKLMRQILVDYARTHNAEKRGGKQFRISLTKANNITTSEKDWDLIEIDDALKKLATIYPLGSQIVELRFFGELTIEETAEVLKLSRDAVKSQWRAARAWLYRELSRR